MNFPLIEQLGLSVVPFTTNASYMNYVAARDLEKLLERAMKVNGSHAKLPPQHSNHKKMFFHEWLNDEDNFSALVIGLKPIEKAPTTAEIIEHLHSFSALDRDSMIRRIKKHGIRE